MWGTSKIILDTVPGADGESEVPKEATNTVGLALQAVADNSTESIIAESAYLIFTDSSLAHLQTLQDCGLKVQILTNSLAANNHTTAFVGYRKQRKEQIAAMSELYEYRPDATTLTSMYQELTPGQTAPHFGLHEKHRSMTDKPFMLVRLTLTRVRRISILRSVSW